MTTIHDAYINALLADAAYVDNLVPGMTGTDLTGILTGRMTPELAKYIGDNFTVVTQVSGLASSFEATVWRDTSGQSYVSMRGTQELKDFQQNADLAISGLAHRQLADMVNWWLRATTRGQAVQIAVRTIVIPGPVPVTVRDFVAAPSVQGTGELAGIGAIKSVEGHSLGGYLASAFVRLFGGQWSVESINTFNSAGFSRLAAANIEDGFNQIAQLIGAALGLGIFSDAQNNYFGENGINVTTNTWNPVGFQQYGTRIGLFQEDLASPFYNNHSMYKLTDLLALGDALAQLDATMDLAKLSRLVSAGSNRMEASYESVLDTLRRLFLGRDVKPTLMGDANASNVGPQPAARLDYHANLQNLLDSASLKSAASSGALTIYDLTDMAASELLTRAQAPNGLAYRYALKELNSFAVLGPDTLYTSHNLGGELNLYLDAVSTPVGLTNQYLVDRAAFFTAKNAANLIDAGSVVVANQVDTWRYVDLPQSYAVTAFGQVPASLARIATFGGDKSDSVAAGNQADRLYGGGGADVLTGNAGDDYLEGGSGRDIYQYNASQGLLGGLANDGADEIRDTDGKGVIRYSYTQPDGLFLTKTENKLIGGVALKVSDTEWRSPDGKFVYTAQFAGLNVAINGDAGGSIRILDFDFAKAQAEGYLGIRLTESPSAPTSPVREFLGDRQDWDRDAVEPGVQTQTDAYGNVLRADGREGRPDLAQADRMDGFSGASADELERFVTGGGDDIVRCAPRIDRGHPCPPGA